MVPRLASGLFLLMMMLGLAWTQSLDLHFDCDAFVATNAVVDPAVSNSQIGGAVTIHDGTLTGNIRNFDFAIDGRFTINSTTATLSGQLKPSGATSLAHGYYFLLNMNLSPDASGRNMLNAGVSVDQSSWMFFVIAAPSYLIGYGDFNSAGPISINQLVASLPFQIGLGANGKNLHLGASVAIDITAGPYHVTGDVNIDLACDLAVHESSSSSSSNELPSSSSSDHDSGIFCPADIFECPDGSSVSRDPNSNCVFFDCPAPVESSSSSDDANSGSGDNNNNGCSLRVQMNRADTWMEHDRLTTLIYVTLKNNGTRDIKDISLAIDIHGDDCSSFAPSCIRQYWSLLPAACASSSESDAAACVFGLPDWLTLYGGLRVGAEHNWGFITYSSITDLKITPTCF